MSKPLNTFRLAQNAFDQWNLLAAHERSRLVAELREQLPETLTTAFDYQYACSTKFTEEEHQLVSPTGETNELYTQGRGVALFLIQGNPEINELNQAVVGLLVSMLITGNSAIVGTENKNIDKLITNLQKTSNLPQGVLQSLSYQEANDLIKQDIRNLAYVGDKENSLLLNKTLSEREGAIVSLVAETDLSTLATVQDPALALRFVTEKVRSTNITAVGGNTMLLGL